MALFKPKKKGDKKDNEPTKQKKETKYVWLLSNKAVFLITGDPKESKYSYGVPIIPLFGYYRSDGKRYTAKELSDYYVILNLPKDANLGELKGKRLVVLGFDEDEIYIGKEEEGEKEEEKGNGK
jgi:hypothetical protein